MTNDSEDDRLYSQRLLRKMESNGGGGGRQRRSASQLDDLEAAKRASYGRDIGDGISSIHRTKRSAMGAVSGGKSRGGGHRIPESKSALALPSGRTTTPPRGSSSGSGTTTTVGAVAVARQSLCHLESGKLQGMETNTGATRHRRSSGSRVETRNSTSSHHSSSSSSASALRRSLSNLENEKLAILREAAAAAAAMDSESTGDSLDPSRHATMDATGRRRLSDLEATKTAAAAAAAAAHGGEDQPREVGAQYIPADAGGRVRLSQLELAAKSGGGGGSIPSRYSLETGTGGPGGEGLKKAAVGMSDYESNDEVGELPQPNYQHPQQEHHEGRPEDSNVTTQSSSVATTTTTTTSQTPSSEAPPIDLDREMRLYSQMEGLYRQHQRYEEQRSFENSMLPSAMEEMAASLLSSRRDETLGRSDSQASANNENNPSVVNAFVAGQGGENGDEEVVDALHVVDLEDIKEEMESTSWTCRQTAVILGIFLLSAAVAAVAAYFLIDWHQTPSDTLAVRVIPVEPSPAPTAAPTVLPTLSPTEFRRVEMGVLLQNVSSAQQLQTEGTPQQRAMQWLIEEDVLQRDAHDPRLIQRYVLAVFYFSTQGELWSCDAKGDSIAEIRCGVNAPKVTFLSQLDECDWNGVECQPALIHNDNDDDDDDEKEELQLIHSFVIRGELKSIYISGTLPSELGHLPMITTFGFSHNGISGTIPPEMISQNRRLENLFLAHNQLSAPFPEEAFRNHPSLRTLSVAHNPIGGTLPSAVATIPNLVNLWMASCGMTGTIPPELGDMPQLKDVKLDDNFLTGTLPSELGQLSTLESLIVSRNHLNGTIPESFYTSWPDLSALALDGNQFSGTIPNVNRLTWGTNNEKRKKIFLSENQLSGTIPPSLALIHPLNTLNLHENNFTGSMPAEICSKTTIESDGEGGIFFRLMNLTTDCRTFPASKIGPEVDCDCCSECY